jgi:hypothetical protein
MLKIISLIFSLVQLVIVIAIIPDFRLRSLSDLLLVTLLFITPIVYLLHPFFEDDGSYSWFSLYSARKKLEEQKKIERLRIQ